MNPGLWGLTADSYRTTRKEPDALKHHVQAWGSAAKAVYTASQMLTTLADDIHQCQPQQHLNAILIQERDPQVRSALERLENGAQTRQNARERAIAAQPVVLAVAPASPSDQASVDNHPEVQASERSLVEACCFLLHSNANANPNPNPTSLKANLASR